MIINTLGKTVKLEVITSRDASEEDEQRKNLDELKNELTTDNIDFNYTFDDTLHDRCIETNTGWKIILGRGLDIFQKPGSRFSTEIPDQTKRKCRVTRITYVRLKT